MTTGIRTDSSPYFLLEESPDLARSTGFEVESLHGVAIRVEATGIARCDYSPKARLKTYLEEFGLRADRITVGDGGDVDAYFFGATSGRFVAISVDREFDMAILFTDREAGSAKAEDIDLEQLGTIRQRVREFLSA